MGAAVRWCEEQGGDLTHLDGGAGARFHRAFPDDLGEWLGARAAAERKTSLGGTAWSEIQRQVAVLREPIGTESLGTAPP